MKFHFVNSVSHSRELINIRGKEIFDKYINILFLYFNLLTYFILQRPYTYTLFGVYDVHVHLTTTGRPFDRQYESV